MKTFTVAAMILGLSSAPGPDKRLAANASKSIDTIAGAFFTKLKAGEIQQAYAATLAGAAFQQKKPEIDKLATQIGGVIDQYGPVYGWERVAEEQKSAFDAVAIYELRLSSIPIFFHMKFYRRDEATPWGVTKISFTDDDDVSIK